MDPHIKSKQRVADHGEVFTPAWMVEAMLDLVKGETERIDSRFLEPACGDGNFLVQVLRRKLAAVELKYGKSDFERRHYAMLAVMCIYGIELLPDNIKACRANLQNFRKFYLAYSTRGAIDSDIQYPMGTKSVEGRIQYPVGTRSPDVPIRSQEGRKLPVLAKGSPPGAVSPQGLSPQISWSHYRAIMRVESREARDFYEREAVEGAWDKRTLERQIHTQYYERCLHSQQPEEIIADGRKLQKTAPVAADVLKSPYVLEFLGYPNFAELRESDMETAIITHLQRFLLELGNGFAFVARQKHVRIEEDDRFIDLVFYHCRLKCYLLIDLKLGKLTHADVGQMDGYVRMYDGLFAAPDDNPTIGLILCTEKNDTVARYSVLKDRKQIFASKYMLCLPTEEQLRLELSRERRLIESNLKDRADE